MVPQSPLYLFCLKALFLHGGISLESVHEYHHLCFPSANVNFDLLSFTTSDTSWTDSVVCKYWFKHIFIPHALSHCLAGEHTLLIFDGHASHKTPEMEELAFKHNILLYCLPPKTTYKLQPLDVGVFSLLQTAWNKHCQECTVNWEVVTHETVMQEYMKVQEKYMVSKPIPVQHLAY